MRHPEPISILDVANEARLYLDSDLDGTGNAMAILHMGTGVRASLDLDRDDVRRLHEWSGAVLAQSPETGV